MAFTNQFSLSLELTKLIPFGALVSTAGRGLIHLVRELQASGSDFLTEEDLAEVFGRNRIDSRFESTFRTALKQSVIQKISDLAELVIEAGGPTVRRSLKEPVYLSTVIQLSLLTFTHHLTSLTGALIRALEHRAKGANVPIPLPRYDALKATLRTCREQTSGFMWELVFSAVETTLAGAFASNKPYDTRPLPTPVLQALLDSFTAVQHLPEDTLLRIRCLQGVVTIVVWAHHVLGLTVVVEAENDVFRFGDGPESVYIDCRYTDNTDRLTQVSLLNETQDLLFHVSEDSFGLGLLEPACRHPVLGYASRILELEVDEPHVIPSFVDAVITSCIVLVRERSTVLMDTSLDSQGKHIHPSAQRVLNVGKYLFAKSGHALDELDLNAEHTCLARSSWQTHELPAILEQYVLGQNMSMVMLKALVLRLAYVVLVISMVTNLESCEGLPLDLFALTKSQYEVFHLPDACEAFSTMARLLLGRSPDIDIAELGNVAVVSAWGWSLCVNAITATDPSQIKPGIVVILGVPMRYGERKRWILDGAAGYGGYGARNAASLSHKLETDYVAVARPGDQVTVESWTRPKKTKFYIEVSEIAFQAAKHFECERIINEGRTEYGILLGFRGMQDLFWQVGHIPACEHSAQLGQGVTVPGDTWVFQGFTRPDKLVYEFSQEGVNKVTPAAWAECQEGAVHAGLVAGDSSARWVLLQRMFNHWGHVDLEPARVLLRGEDCCFDCAVRIAKSRRRGHNVGLVL
ncbi:hypothetical protein MMC12_004763 [Toensbergia leucococca]|nr:hypothetical protein [Toensbergia leucococca]